MQRIRVYDDTGYHIFMTVREITVIGDEIIIYSDNDPFRRTHGMTDVSEKYFEKTD